MRNFKIYCDNRFFQDINETKRYYAFFVAKHFDETLLKTVLTKRFVFQIFLLMLINTYGSSLVKFLMTQTNDLKKMQMCVFPKWRFPSIRVVYIGETFCSKLLILFLWFFNTGLACCCSASNKG